MGVPAAGDTHPLHGELPNAPYQSAYIVLGEDAGGAYIGLGGRYQHTVAFSTNYAAEPLVKLYAGAHTSLDNLREEMQRHIAVHRKTLDSLLSIERDYLALPDEQRKALRLPYLTLRRGILGEQSWLAWADEFEQELQHN